MPLTPVPFPLHSLPADELLGDLLAVSMTGVIYYTPLYDPAGTGEIVDFTFEYLNPAAQRMMAMPEVPTVTHNQQWPHSIAHGTFQFHVDAYVSGEPREYNINYQADGYDNYYRLAARRSGDGMWVSFTDTADQPRSPVELALRDSQAAEQAARADAVTQRQRLHEFMSAAPGIVLSLVGPQHLIAFANEGFRQQFGVPAEVGKPFLEAIPGVADQYAPQYRATDLYDHIYHTGEPYHVAEAPYYVDPTHSGQRELRYFTFSAQAARDGRSRIVGVQVFAYDVTEQVLARHQVQDLNQELAAANEELRATNDEFLASNAALGRAQQQLQQLNQELEDRVQTRTRELQQAQAETEAQRRRLHQLVAQAPALIASLRGPEHVVELANEGFRAIFGGRALVGKTYRQAIPEFANQPFFDRLDRVYRTGETYSGIDEPVMLDRTNSGQLEHTYITYTYQATRGAQGQVDGILVFCYEVTEQVLARREREIQRQLLTDVFAQAPAGIWVVRGSDYVFEVINPTMTRVIKRTAEQCLGRPYFEVLPELTSQGVPELLRRVWEQGESMLVEEFAAQLDPQAPDEVGYFTFAFQPLRDEHGQVTRISCVALDVTAQVRARQQVQELNQTLQATNAELGTANEQLQRTNVDLDNFIYTASHDLKAPISNLEGLLLALQQELPPADRIGQVPTLLAMMQQSVDRFSRTIAHLTDLSRLQQEYEQPATQVPLARVLDEVQLDLLPLLTATGGQVAVHMPADLTLTFAEKNLRSVVYNLLSNALKYRHPDRVPRVRVTCQPTASGHVLQVQDNGLGMDLATGQAKLFGLFQRLHTHVEGTGVGLHMVKRMVENAGGTITVHSQLGEGSTFTITLPS